MVKNECKIIAGGGSPHQYLTLPRTTAFWYADHDNGYSIGCLNEREPSLSHHVRIVSESYPFAASRSGRLHSTRSSAGAHYTGFPISASMSKCHELATK